MAIMNGCGDQRVRVGRAAQAVIEPLESALPSFVARSPNVGTGYELTMFGGSLVLGDSPRVLAEHFRVHRLWYKIYV
jgi:hypothetical protein